MIHSSLVHLPGRLLPGKETRPAEVSQKYRLLLYFLECKEEQAKEDRFMSSFSTVKWHHQCAVIGRYVCSADYTLGMFWQRLHYWTITVRFIP
jgi:hypothetical protein